MSRGPRSDGLHEIKSLPTQKRTNHRINFFRPTLSICQIPFPPFFDQLFRPAPVTPPPLKRSISDGDLSSSKKKAKNQDYEDVSLFLGSESAPVNPPPVRCSIRDGDIISRTKTDTHQDAGVFLPPSMRDNHQDDEDMFATPRVFDLSFDTPKQDPKIYLEKAWGLLKPAIRSIFLDEPYSFSCAGIYQAWGAKSGEPLFNLILDECGTYISTAIQSFAGHCNDDDPSLFVSLLEKCWLDFCKKMLFLCSFAAGYKGRWSGRKLEQLGLELFPTHLFSASQVRDKVLSIILDLIRDQRIGKSVDTSQLKNLMRMFNGDCFRKSSFLKKPFLDSAAEFYAAEAMQLLEQSDVPQYLKFVERRLGEEKSKCSGHYFFTIFEDELIEIVTRELLGVHACAILEKGFEKLMDEIHWEGLLRMYDLFSEADLVHHINDALTSYILKTGEKISSEGSSLEEFMARVDEICTSYFREDRMLEKTLEKYFEGLGLPWKDRFTVDC